MKPSFSCHSKRATQIKPSFVITIYDTNQYFHNKPLKLSTLPGDTIPEEKSLYRKIGSGLWRNVVKPRAPGIA